MPCHLPVNDIVAKMARPLDLGGKPLVISRTHNKGTEPDRLLTPSTVGMAIGRGANTITGDFTSGKLEGITHGDYTYKPHQPKEPEKSGPGDLSNMSAMQLARNAGAKTPEPCHECKGNGCKKCDMTGESPAQRDMTGKEKDESSRGSGSDLVQMAEKEYGQGSASLFKPRQPQQNQPDPKTPPQSAAAIEGTLGRGTTGQDANRNQTPIRKAENEEVGDWTTRMSPKEQLEVANRLRNRKGGKAPKNLDAIIAAHIAKRKPPAEEK